MIKVRIGRKKDLSIVLELIKELALYEKALDQVENTVENMELEGFGKRPSYGFFVAENDNQEIIGLSLYYYRYSTWKGKRLYLEELIVTEKYRGLGIGKMLFDATIKHGLDQFCNGMVWQVLEWNEKGKNFYKKYYQAHMDNEWVNCSLSKQQMLSLIKK